MVLILKERIKTALLTGLKIKLTDTSIFHEATKLSKHLEARTIPRVYVSLVKQANNLLGADWSLCQGLLAASQASRYAASSRLGRS